MSSTWTRSVNNILGRLHVIGTCMLSISPPVFYKSFISKPPNGSKWCFSNQIHPFTHKFIQRFSHISLILTRYSRPWQFGVRCLAQQHFSTQTGGAGDQTTNPLAPSPEPQPQVTSSIRCSRDKFVSRCRFIPRTLSCSFK